MRQQFSHDTMKGLLLWQQWANEEYKLQLNNATIQFQLKILEDFGNVSQVRLNYKQLVEDNSVNYLMAPVTTELALEAMNVTETANRLLIGILVAADSFFQETNKAFSVYPSASRFALQALPTLRLKGAENITIVTEDSVLHSSICAGVAQNAPDYSLEVVKTLSIEASDVEPTDEQKQRLRDTILQVKKLGSDVLMICSFSPNVQYMLQQMQEMDYLPNAVVVDLIGDNLYGDTDPNLVTYLAGHDVAGPGIDYKDVYFGSYSRFKARFRTQFLQEAVPTNAYATVAGLLLTVAIETAGTLDDDEVAQALGRNQVETFFGPYQFGSDHTQLRPVPFLQYQPTITVSDVLTNSSLNSTLLVLAPSRIQQVEMIYPAPKWNERFFNPQYNDVDWGVFAVTILSMALSVALLICVLAYRRNPVISHSSSLFLCYILVGTLISYSSIFVDSPSNVSVATCTLNPLLLGIGFIMTFGSLFAKVWRIWSLYNNKSLTINNITDARLTIITAVLVAIEIAITVVIAALGNDPLLSIEDPYKPSTWQMECSTSNVRTIFVIIAVVYNGAVVAVGIYLTVRIRVIPNKVYNESKLLAFIIYCIAFCGVAVVALEFSGAVETHAMFAIRAFGIIIGNLITVITLFVNKFHYVRTGFGSGKLSPINSEKGHQPGDAMSRGTNESSMYSQYSAGRSGYYNSTVSSMDDEFINIKSEIEKLMGRVKELTKHNEVLKGQNSELTKELNQLKNANGGLMLPVSSSNAVNEENNHNSAPPSSELPELKRVGGPGSQPGSRDKEGLQSARKSEDKDVRKKSGEKIRPSSPKGENDVPLTDRPAPLRSSGAKDKEKKRFSERESKDKEKMPSKRHRTDPILKSRSKDSERTYKKKRKNYKKNDSVANSSFERRENDISKNFANFDNSRPSFSSSDSSSGIPELPEFDTHV
jgi:ABC-type branched-subunit amino acid transport system substrate-binding protein